MDAPITTADAIAAILRRYGPAPEGQAVVVTLPYPQFKSLVAYEDAEQRLAAVMRPARLAPLQEVK